MSRYPEKSCLQGDSDPPDSMTKEENNRRQRWHGTDGAPTDLNQHSEPQLTATPRPLKYGRIQSEGEKRKQWLEDPNEPNCYIQRSTLTIEDLRTDYKLPCTPHPCSLESVLTLHWMELGPPEMPRSPIKENNFRSFHIMHHDFTWIGHTGPDMITLDQIERNEDYGAPHISQITQALYQSNFDLDGLRYAFVTNVKNTETLQFIKRQLYNEANTGLTWPNDIAQPWEIGTSEYDALLGTRIGKMVAYFLLGAFGRGTRRIQRIVTWPARVGGFANLRFDVEVVR
ncbi:hypothetical protein N7509_013925 [Penicillium cosmopolitanum]|uniref:Uncharacterized protein n=1 Tax=Penicillium cosmopolitanum TaxID=1131564 RepID=A0A9W9SG78_9EURO|nr:uncharacterized protein N7509_013925 [Penicillium cosmopolitanum]KAJ5377039.1 hypothetical protein N7509_013925 [Penicillium cosmopolitanum]